MRWGYCSLVSLWAFCEPTTRLSVMFRKAHSIWSKTLV
ncbi:Uncharacterised protein [Vibrio cholerae]|nr:Uncharacterised protein [Vibrio cholerae]